MRSVITRSLFIAVFFPSFSINARYYNPTEVVSQRYHNGGAGVQRLAHNAKRNRPYNEVVGKFETSVLEKKRSAACC